jgi:hypothetical protein
MLNYSGLLKSKLKKKLTAMIDMNKGKNDTNEWFEDFVKNASAADSSSIPLPMASSGERRNKAAVIIQKRWRGMSARSRVRKIFVKVYTKRLDPQSKAYYYVNLKTNESSWTRPRFMNKLFPGTKW